MTDSDPSHRRKRATSPQVVSTSGIPPDDLDQDALRVISRLVRNGHEAYLVGGCVRDLLLGRIPKDFDVATSAHPRQVKRLFRNGRIIGRRFKLVHVFYGDHIIETATFRQEPGGNGTGDGEDLLIVEDNVFGTAEEDARRRDFTVNGLFLDPTRNRILDYVGGLRDLDHGLIRTIGDPDVRMAEDPVRIMRAVKFATRLGFRIDEGTWEAMKDHAPDLERAAKPRVLEEILRLLRSGSALGAFRMLRECGALRVLLPPIERFLREADQPGGEHDREERFWGLLEALDADVHAGRMPSNAVAIALLFLPLVEARAEELVPPGRKDPEPTSGDLLAAASDVLEPFGQNTRLSRRDSHRARRVISLLPRFVRRSRKRFSPLLFMRSEEFPEALTLFRLECMATGQGWDVYEGWLARSARAEQASDEEVLDARHRRRRKRRRPPRSRRKGSGEDADDDPGDD